MLARHLIQYFGVLSRPYMFLYIIELFCCIKYTIYTFPLQVGQTLDI